MRRYVVREVDHGGFAKSRENDAFHDSSKRAFVAEIGGNRDYAGRLPVIHCGKS
jgi:hypothetical protein